VARPRLVLLTFKESFMHHARFDLRRSFFAAWSLAVLVAVAGCSDDPTEPPIDTVAPQVSSTNPLNGAIGAAVITASFSEAMNASTITLATFTLHGPGATPVAGTVSYNPSTEIASFTPTNASRSIPHIPRQSRPGQRMSAAIRWPTTMCGASRPRRRRAILPLRRSAEPELSWSWPVRPSPTRVRPR